MLFEPVKTPAMAALRPELPSIKASEILKRPEPLAVINDRWGFQGYLGAFLARTTSWRNRYDLRPGLYAFGTPGDADEILVTANYKLTFDKLRRHLRGRNSWILVLDTKGINVWCAAGKGTFGTKELISKINEWRLHSLVNHRRVIVPQLGAVGIAAHAVQKSTGFRVHYGPVDARDLIAYLDNNRVATPAMRRVRFNWRDRLVLTPMELIPSFKYFWKYALAVGILFGFQPGGIIFANVLNQGGPYMVVGAAGVISGALLAPLLLPFLPFRSFAVKGWFVGAATVAALWAIFADSSITRAMIEDPSYYALWFSAFSVVFIPAVSSFVALQFTGSTTYTHMTGVYKEHKYALPFYIFAAIFSIAIIVGHKLFLLYVEFA